MTKRVLALLPLLCLVMFAMVGSASAPTAAPLTPSASPAVCAPSDPSFGGCRWYCGSRSYSTAAECAAHCSTECEEIC